VNLFNESVTITNTSGAPINGPLNFVFIGLPTPSGVGLTSPSGSTTCFGSTASYLNVSGGLPTGARVMFGVDFVDPLPSNPSYSYRVLSGNP
jgi:hypothetical protein